MTLIRFTRNIQRHIECPPTEATGSTLAEVLESYFTTNPQARGYLLDDQGALRKHMAVFLNGTQISDRTQLSDAIGEGDVVDIMQALSGG